MATLKGQNIRVLLQDGTKFKVVGKSTNATVTLTESWRIVTDAAPDVERAAENGIVNGTSSTTFAPEQKVTREQMCVMLCNYYNYKKMTWEEEEATLNFPDNSEMSDWALPSITKVVSEKIMSGRSDGTFDPRGNATRAEAAKIISIVKEIFDYNRD